jgi:fructose-1,6-bisphosphatase/sedoheptulose 1,7-bisphosphatase-like protein
MPDGVAEKLMNLGIKDPTGVLKTTDMVPGDKVAFAFAAVTDSRLADGVHDFDPEPDEQSGHRVNSYLMMTQNGERIVRAGGSIEVRNWPEFVFPSLL